MHASASQPYEPSSKRFKSDLTFQCIVCNTIYDDPNSLYEHMQSKHQDLYGHEDGNAADSSFDSDSDPELSDKEYLNLSRLLEPICELTQEDDDNEPQNTNFDASNVISQLIQNNPFAAGLNEEQLRLQFQLQMQIQNHLLQVQMNNAMQKANKGVKRPKKEEKPLSMR